MQSILKIIGKMKISHIYKISMPRISINEFLPFIIWPFAVLLKYLKHYKYPRSKTIFWLFCIYFGFVFIYDDPSGIGGSDSARYAALLIEFHKSSLSFTTLLNNIYSPSGDFVDIYQPVITWILSIFTGNPQILFAVFAAIFGFFYVQNLWIIFQYISRKITFLLFLLMIGYALMNPIWFINGARMWTAAQVFLFGNLLYFVQHNTKGLIWSSVSVLIHFSFIFPLIVLVGFLWIPKYPNIIFILFLLSSSFIEINILEISRFLPFLPEIFKARISSYLNPDYIERFNIQSSSLAFHVKWAGFASRWFLYTWIASIYFRRKEWSSKLPHVFKLFLFALWMGTFANIASNLPSGGRYYVLSNAIFLGVFVILIGAKFLKIKLNLIQIITIPLLIYSIIFKLRLGLDYIGILTFLGNPLFALFINNQIPLIDLIKSIL